MEGTRSTREQPLPAPAVLQAPTSSMQPLPVPIHDLVRPSIRAMKPYVHGEQIPGAIKLNTNECGWPPSAAIRDLLAHWDEERFRKYPDPVSLELRRQAAAVFRHPVEGILAGNGSDDCLTIIYRTFLDPGARIAMPWPTYSLYDNLAVMQGAEFIHLPWDSGPSPAAGPPGWCLPAALADTGARIVFISNPNNPSSTYVPVEHLRRFIANCPGIVIVDEAYADFVTGQPSSLIPHLAELPNAIVIRTFSKSYSLAGARLGLLFAHPELVGQLMKVKDTYNLNALSQAIGTAALADQAYHHELVHRTLLQRDRLEAALGAWGWTWPSPQANFLLCRVGPQAPDLLRRLKERKMLVRWWGWPELKDCLRITAGRDDEVDQLLFLLRGFLG